jgi:hypothetical protein
MTFYEQNWILDYLKKYPDIILSLDHKYNYIEGLSNPQTNPIIIGYHGQGIKGLESIKRDILKYK